MCIFSVDENQFCHDLGPMIINRETLSNCKMRREIIGDNFSGCKTHLRSILRKSWFRWLGFTKWCRRSRTRCYYWRLLSLINISKNEIINDTSEYSKFSWKSRYDVLLCLTLNKINENCLQTRRSVSRSLIQRQFPRQFAIKKAVNHWLCVHNKNYKLRFEVRYSSKYLHCIHCITFIV